MVNRISISIILISVSLLGCEKFNYGYKSININPNRGFEVDLVGLDTSIDSVLAGKSKHLTKLSDIDGVRIKFGGGFKGGQMFTGIISDYNGHTTDTLNVIDGVPTDGELKIFNDGKLVMTGIYLDSKLIGNYIVYDNDGEVLPKNDILE